MKSSGRPFSLLAMLGALVVSAVCQDAAHTVRAFTGVKKSMILQRPDVQKDLAISGTQKTKLGPLLQGRMQAMANGSEGKDEDAKIFAVLTQDQRSRLDQIALQMSGGDSLIYDEQLKGILGVTNSEVEKLKDEIENNGSPLLSAKEAMPLLTASQAAKFKQMLGRPFVADARGSIEMPHPTTASNQPHVDPLKAGTMAPDFTAYSVDGNPVKLSSLKGKIVVLDFWATWCGPCMASMPGTNSLQLRTADQNVYVLAVNVWDNKPAFDKWAATNSDLSVHLAFDPAGSTGSGKITDLYGVSGIPTTFVIDADGKIIGSNEGSTASAAGPMRKKIAVSGTPEREIVRLLESLGVHISP